MEKIYLADAPCRRPCIIRGRLFRSQAIKTCKCKERAVCVAPLHHGVFVSGAMVWRALCHCAPSSVWQLLQHGLLERPWLGSRAPPWTNVQGKCCPYFGVAVAEHRWTRHVEAQCERARELQQHQYSMEAVQNYLCRRSQDLEPL